MNPSHALRLHWIALILNLLPGRMPRDGSGSSSESKILQSNVPFTALRGGKGLEMRNSRCLRSPNVTTKHYIPKARQHGDWLTACNQCGPALKKHEVVRLTLHGSCYTSKSPRRLAAASTRRAASAQPSRRCANCSRVAVFRRAGEHPTTPAPNRQT